MPGKLVTRFGVIQRVQSCKRADKFRPEPETISLNPKINLKPKSCPKDPKVELGLKNLAISPSHFDYFFVHLRQKVRLRPELSPKFFSILGLNPARLTTLSEYNERFDLQMTQF